jgi:hypothetical protein
MAALIVGIVWVAISVVIAILARFGVVRFAKHRGWTAITMPMSYHIWVISIYLVLVYAFYFTLDYLFL